MMFKVGDKVVIDFKRAKLQFVNEEKDGKIFEVTYVFNFLEACKVRSIRTGNMSTVDPHFLSRLGFQEIFNGLDDKDD